jgi:hypothetical protein
LLSLSITDWRADVEGRRSGGEVKDEEGERFFTLARGMWTTTSCNKSPVDS